jgi:ParB/RepB/Spo0J family partition protein
MSTQLDSLHDTTAENSTNLPAARPRGRMMMVALDLVDEPELAMRQSFDKIKLQELADSIKAQGILQNLVLIQNGSRYRVAAGHRRTVAARMAGETDVPAMVFAAGTSEEEAMKCAENSHREEVNVVDEAVYFWALFESRCGHDIDRVCALVQRPRSYVEGRIELLQGDEEILAELRAERIAIGIARELNKISDAVLRKMGLEFAIRGGATVSVMRNWRQEQERIQRMQTNPQLPGNAAANGDVLPAEAYNPFVCTCCKGADLVETMVSVFVHNHCKLAILDKLLATYRGE